MNDRSVIWTDWDSNPEPSPRKGTALPLELPALRLYYDVLYKFSPGPDEISSQFWTYCIIGLTF